MKNLSLSLSLVLFFSPVLAQETANNKPHSISKTEIKVNISLLPKASAKVITALVKAGVGAGLIALFGYGIKAAFHDTKDVISIKIQPITEYRINDKIETDLSWDKIDIFKPLLIAAAVSCGMGIATGVFAINSAVNDLQSLNTEINE